MIRILAVLAFLSLPLAVAWAAGPLDRAIGLWLDGNDRDSLPALAELAHSGNTDARLLLSRIETTDKGPSPYRLSLPLNEARALFRLDQGLGGLAPTWIKVEADQGNPLARALLQSRMPRPDLAVIEVLHAMGEVQATDHPTRIIALYGDEAAHSAIAESGLLLDELAPYLSYLSRASEPSGDGLAALRHITGTDSTAITSSDPEALGMAGLLALGYGFGDLSPDNRWRPAVGTWLMTSPAMQPIADICRSDCSDAAPACAFAFLALSGGYFEAIRLDSPLETLIPQADFLASPRARLMTLRRAALARAETNVSWLASHAEIAEMSHCAADLIVAERMKYK